MCFGHNLQLSINMNVGAEDLTALNVNIVNVRDVMACSMVDVSKQPEGTAS
jgi:hypothetical protein